MMRQPSRPESQSEKLLGIAVSKHSSTYQQFLHSPHCNCHLPVFVAGPKKATQSSADALFCVAQLIFSRSKFVIWTANSAAV
jgi:hypothetical protein